MPGLADHYHDEDGRPLPQPASPPRKTAPPYQPPRAIAEAAPPATPAAPHAPKPGRRSQRNTAALETTRAYSAAIDRGDDPLAPDITPPPPDATSAERASARAQKAANTVRARKLHAKIEEQSEQTISRIAARIAETQRKADAETAQAALDPPGTPTAPAHRDGARAQRGGTLYRKAHEARAPWKPSEWSAETRTHLGQALTDLITTEHKKGHRKCTTTTRS